MLVLGHRGEPRLAPENTVASFALIRDDLDHGVDGAECDVQMTKDGELVVIHDEKVDRTTDGSGFVKDLTLQEIRKLNAGVRFPGPLHHEPIPTMREVFEVFDGTGGTLNVELKNSEIAYEGMEERLLELAGRYSLNVVYSSFNVQSMGVIRRLDAKARTGLLFAPWLIKAPDVVAAAHEQGANAIHPYVSIRWTDSSAKPMRRPGGGAMDRRPERARGVTLPFRGSIRLSAMTRDGGGGYRSAQEK